tara:strand:- start:174 stop:662 length:489 start_codon:yes stop_codon:yes gene_type:complete
MENYLEILSNLKLTDVVIKQNVGLEISKDEIFLNSLNNENMNLIIIDSMCLGLLLNDHIANQFTYIRMLVERNEIKYYKNYNIKIFQINNKWDTYNWCYHKIEMFYYNLNQIENKTIPEIEETITNSNFVWDRIDIEFLKSLSWGYDNNETNNNETNNNDNI